jgi:hypothetical protein
MKESNVVKLSLRMTHPNRDLSAVCSRLGLTPSRIWKAGENRSTPKGNIIGGVRGHSYCSIDLGSFKHLSISIERGIEWLRPHKDFLRRFSNDGGQITFYAAWFADGIVGDKLRCDLWRDMGSFRIVLELEIYCKEVECA